MNFRPQLVAVLLALVSLTLFLWAKAWLPAWLALISLGLIVWAWKHFKELTLNTATGVHEYDHHQWGTVELMNDGWMATVNDLLIIGKGPSEGPTKAQEQSVQKELEKLSSRLSEIEATAASFLPTAGRLEIESLVISDNDPPQVIYRLLPLWEEASERRLLAIPNEQGEFAISWAE